MILPCNSSFALVAFVLGLGSAFVPVGRCDADEDTVGVRVLKDHRYGSSDGKSGLCDVYLPRTPKPADGYPVVLVVHGGGWVSGDKWTIAGYAFEFARNGFAAVTVNYRLAPRHKFPKQVDDVRQALLWTQENAERFSLDMDRLGLFGYSAGGHLVTLVASLADEPMATRLKASQWSENDERWSKLPTIHAVCAGGPPCDFRLIPPGNKSLAYFLGGSRADDPEVYETASPTAHVSASDPATQIIHGENDMLVPVSDSRRLHEAQKAAGIDSRLKVLPKQGHMIVFVNPETSKTAVEFFQQMIGFESADEDKKN